MSLGIEKRLCDYQPCSQMQIREFQKTRWLQGYPLTSYFRSTKTLFTVSLIVVPSFNMCSSPDHSSNQVKSPTQTSIMSSASLCSTCVACLSHHQGLQTLENSPNSLMFFHHSQPQTLKDSATAKCPICRPLWLQLEPLQSEIPYEVRDQQPLTFLLLQPPESLGVERSYELAAYLNDDATTLDGIEHGSVLIFLLQDRKGRLNMCVIAQFILPQG